MSTPFDLHVLSTPPAFILSQDQTLNKMVSEELSLLRSSYRSYPLASKKSLRAFQVTRLERTSVLFWCFVFLSSRCLIYKVHAALQRAFILPHSVVLVKHFFNFFRSFCQRLARLRLTRTHLVYQIAEFLSRTFFEVFRISRDTRSRSL